MVAFKNISETENEELLKFPVYISLLAANADDRLDEAEKKSAVEFAHTKTFSSNPLLSGFYGAVNKAFENNIIELDKALPKEKDRRAAAIKEELLRLEKIVSELDEEDALIFHESMESFRDHVSKAHHNQLFDFIFPIPIPGLTA